MKYIIEIPDWIEWGVVTCRTEDGFFTRDFDSLEELNSDYINEHYGRLQDEAYQRGFEDGKWKAEDGCTGCMWEGNPYDACEQCCNAYKNLWTAKDDKIEVGDEVIYNGTRKCLVVRPESDDRYAVLIDSNGNHHHADHSECKKTGRHFDIASILKEMQS